MNFFRHFNELYKVLHNTFGPQMTLPCMHLGRMTPGPTFVLECPPIYLLLKLINKIIRGCVLHLWSQNDPKTLPFTYLGGITPGAMCTKSSVKITSVVANAFNIACDGRRSSDGLVHLAPGPNFVFELFILLAPYI